MICTCSTAREMGLNTSDLPMHIYGPPGLAEYIRCSWHDELSPPAWSKGGVAACVAQ